MDTLLTVKGAAEYLQISIWTIYTWVERKQIPCFRVPGSNRIRFRTEDLDKWLQQGFQESAADTAEELLKDPTLR